MLVAAGAAVAFAVLGRRPRTPGFFVRFLVLCGPLRILLDLARENPRRYLGATVDEWAALLLIAAGVWVIVQMREFASERPADGGP